MSSVKRGKWDSPESDGEKPLTKKKASVAISACSLVSAEYIAEEGGALSAHVLPSNEPPSAQTVSTHPPSIAVHDVASQGGAETGDYNPLFYGCRSVERYQRLNFIDQGTYGVVFKAKCRDTGDIVALKQVKMGQLTSKTGFPITALREANILLHLRHPNIVMVKEMVVGSSIDKIFMVMEHCGSDLKSCIQKSKQSFSLAEVKCLMSQLLSGLAFMHKSGFIHRDLKTSNLLYTNGKLSICDFGMARKYSEPPAAYTREVVTLWYRSPELLLGAGTYGTPLDVWSAGCIFAELVCGKPLFPGEGEVDQISCIFNVLGAPNEDTWPGSSLLPHFSKISYRAPSRLVCSLAYHLPSPMVRVGASSGLYFRCRT